MKVLVKQSRKFIMVTRLAVGLTGTVQGILINEYALSIAGFLLVYMAIAGMAANKHYTLILKQAGYEKVDARL